jgi:hypothetical protein
MACAKGIFVINKADANIVARSQKRARHKNGVDKTVFALFF